MIINNVTHSPFFQTREVKDETTDETTDETKDKKYQYQDSTTFKALRDKKDVVVENPNGELDGDDFLKLFLESLKHQDPTSPVETKDMMVQTAQLTTVETNVANKKALEAVTETLTKNSDYQAQFGLLPAIGRLAITKNDTVAFDGSNPHDFQLYFENNPKSGSITINDSKGNKVREISLLQYINEAGKVGEDEKGLQITDSKGILNFTWNGTNDGGALLPKGAYKIKADYVGSDGKGYSVSLGTNIVESVKFENSQPFLKLGDKYVKFSEVSEVK